MTDPANSAAPIHFVKLACEVFRITRYQRVNGITLKAFANFSPGLRFGNPGDHGAY